MVNIDILKERGVSVEAWKDIFTKPKNERDAKVNKFMDRMWNRASNGINNNIENFKLYLAIDEVWDAPLKQITPSLIGIVSNRLRNIGKTKDIDEVKRLAESIGYPGLIVDEEDPKTKKKVYKLDVPTYSEITIALCRSYLTARWAKIDNDRRTIPVLKYDPVFDTPESRVRCDAITHRIQRMAEQLGYNQVRKTGILKTLLYGVQLKFIESEWFYEEQVVGKKPDGITDDKKCVKEGLNYYYPHPNKYYWDRAYPVTSFNYDNGCQFAGFWKLMRYGELAAASNFWNLDKIGFSKDWLNGDKWAAFSSATANTMVFPVPETSSRNDAQSALNNFTYNNQYDDAACMVVEHHEKIKPSDVGLGDYDCPIWARFVMAGDGTVIYATPLPACGITAFADSYDCGRMQNSSMALEILPFQDTVTNLLRQALLAAKANMQRITFVDKNILDDDVVRAIEKTPNWAMALPQYIRVDMTKLNRSDLDIEKAILPVHFPQQNSSECISIISTILGLLERVCQISAMESGGTASHEQTSEEIMGIREATTNRLQFTANVIDDEAEAWKRQLYAFEMAFGEDDMYLQVGTDQPMTDEFLQGLGFTVVNRDASERFAQVRANKTALAMDAFASAREGTQRTNNVQLAGAMSQMLIAVTNNQIIMQAIGQAQVIELMNHVIQVMGLPKDFKLKLAQQDPGMQQGQEQGHPTDVIANAIAPLVESLKQIRLENNTQQQAIDSITQILERTMQQQQQPARSPQPEMPPNFIPPAQQMPMMA